MHSKYYPSRHSLVQNKQWEHYNNVLILFKLRIKTERRQWRISVVFIINFEQISHIVLMLMLAGSGVLFKKWLFHVSQMGTKLK